MLTHSWIRKLFSRSPRTGRKAAAPGRRVSFRPRVEALEERLNPAPTLHGTWEGIDQGRDRLLHFDTTHTPPDPHSAIGTRRCNIYPVAPGSLT